MMAEQNSVRSCSKLSSICVFCGSRFGNDPTYEAAAIELGIGLAQAGQRLVYGAGDVGLMGAIARACQDAGGEIFGVMPVQLLQSNAQKQHPEHFILTENMHERKKVMFMNADALVVLPGGPGSLDEFFEVLTWAQIGLHTKPIYLWNINGYWDLLIALIEHQISEGFCDSSLRELIQIVETLPKLLTLLRSVV